MMLLLAAGCLMLTEADRLAHTDVDGDGSPSDQDCDDNNSAMFPGNPEICDGLDNDCDATVDEGVQSIFYADEDADGFGDASDTTTACDAPSGTVSLSGPSDTDCDDTDSAVNPGAAEVCDGVDNDCDGDIDTNATDLTTYYVDNDGDGYGYGMPDQDWTACEAPEGYVAAAGDCDDSDPNRYPGAPELCDRQFNDCEDTATWTAQVELGAVTWTHPNGVHEDLSASFHSDAGETLNVKLPNAGLLRICRDKAPYTIHLYSQSLSELTIRGIPIALTEDPEEETRPTLNGNASQIFDIDASSGDSDDWVLAISGLQVINGFSPSGGGGGGGQFSDGYSLTISESLFTDNHCNKTTNQFGCGISVINLTRVTLDNVVFQGNTEPQKDAYGGGVYAESIGAQGFNTKALCEQPYVGLFISNSTFSDNKGSLGGGLYVSNSRLCITNTTFSDNQAMRGGGLYFYGGRGELNNSILIDNQAEEGGGGLAVGAEDGALHLNDTRLLNNYARDGGAAEVDHNLLTCTFTTTLTDGAVLEGNTAQLAGAVFSTLGNGALHAEGCTSADNLLKETSEGMDLSIFDNAHTYSLTGGTFTCDKTGCTGDVLP
ncbi:MAG: hypothetical protein ACI8RZ_005962 [Myxococcota bacterium]|jgi:hypothetical protein